MNVTFAYSGHSQVIDSSGGGRQTFQLVPNLTRDPVAFDAPLLQPLRFREAMSSLHDCVISDLRFKKKDKTAYLAWKQNEARREPVIRREALRAAMAEVLAKQNIPIEQDFLSTFEHARKKYWNARAQYASYLYKHDRELWRKLMPCDPVITVADDVLFFECFSADESSYGCLSAASLKRPPRWMLSRTVVQTSVICWIEVPGRLARRWRSVMTWKRRSSYGVSMSRLHSAGS